MGAGFPRTDAGEQCAAVLWGGEHSSDIPHRSRGENRRQELVRLEHPVRCSEGAGRAESQREISGGENSSPGREPIPFPGERGGVSRRKQPPPAHPCRPEPRGAPRPPPPL